MTSGDKFFRFMNRYSIYVILAVLMVACSLASPNFLTVQNLTNVSRQISITTIIAMAETILIIAGMIDLAAGAVLALAGVLSVATYVATGSLVLALGVGALVGVLCNSLSGLVVVKFRTPPFIATLAMQTAARGAALSYTGGQNIYRIGNYTIFGQGYIGPIPTPVLFMLAVVVLTWYILRHTRFGRHLYAVGGNEDAARASGVSIGNTKFIAYAVSGVFVGLAGVLYMSRNNAGLPNAGAGLEFDAMTAAIIGGTSFSGGVGTAMGTLAGGFIMGFLNNGMNLLGVHAYTQQIVRGAIIVLAVIWDVYSKGRRVSAGKPVEAKTGSDA
ncbi:MAG: ABC transporter permease [Planctomycetaceae bacterium]|nr:ABC transporter permease [Planctomycetaceae bacterium]